ncbi:hypothetical protein O181_062206 [Austropuccinia psidii MF-1]|uniref:Retrotransposon gag domain-containing protein n=1 Tax=Austropuccinia psidii MF-1 TaxID=1389203 RepID=A0A9Q3HY87_9BASI|nr:hypothetical protein [Austropuccinia psidii MF-1]
MIDEMKFIKYVIDIKIGNLDAKLKKLTSDINNLKNNDRSFAEWHKVKNAKLKSISNTCDRIERKCKVQNDEVKDLSIKKINDKIELYRTHVEEIVHQINPYATHLERSDSERQKLKNEIISYVEQIHNKHEQNSHMPRNSKPFTEEKISVKEILTPFLGLNAICPKDIPKLLEWPTFPGEGKYNHIELIRKIDMLKEDFHITIEIIVGKIHSLFTRTAKKWYYKMRQDHGKHNWLWWKSEIITKWANNSWRLEIENYFQSTIKNSEKDKTLTWFLKQKDTSSALHPDMSASMINMKILRKCGGELEHSNKRLFLEPFSTENLINSMEDIITRKGSGKTWTKTPMESKMVPNISKEDKRPERPVFKCHKCGSTSH